LQAGGREFDPP